MGTKLQRVRVPTRASLFEASPWCLISTPGKPDNQYKNFSSHESTFPEKLKSVQVLLIALILTHFLTLTIVICDAIRWLIQHGVKGKSRVFFLSSESHSIYSLKFDEQPYILFSSLCILLSFIYSLGKLLCCLVKKHVCIRCCINFFLQIKYLS